MKRLTRLMPPAVIGLVGFALGVWSAIPLSVAPAQVSPSASAARALAEDVSEANAERIMLATEALNTAQAALVQEGHYVAAVRGLNPYATLSGGVDAVKDLEEGRGVDPFTFAGLHIGLAVDDVLPHLGTDTVGRLTYKGKLVRMYPPERMKEIRERQAAIIAISQGGPAP